MKTMIKKNAMALAALAIAAGSFGVMSFGTGIGESQQNAGWYAVAPPSGGDQQIQNRIGDTLPPGDCQTDFNGEVCAVYWADELTAPPSTLSAVMTADPTAEQAKHEEN